MAATTALLKQMNIPYTGKESRWSSATHDAEQVTFAPLATDSAIMPDLTGMGARDAVYAIESRGMKARVRGYGRVKSQSLPYGSKVQEGKVVTLELN